MNPLQFISDFTTPFIAGLVTQPKLFASVAMAQAILETNSGASVIPGTNNLFNIKADSSWKGASVQAYDAAESSNDYYRVYPNYASSIADWADFLNQNSRYANAGVFSAPDSTSQAIALQNAGYATDPNYANKLISIINQYDLTALDKKKI